MFQQAFRFDPGANILIPALPDPSNQLAPAKFGANLTLPKGQSLAVKTSDGNVYPFNRSATDGTQNWCAFNQVAGATDANGIFYRVVGQSGGVSNFDAGSETGAMYTGGVFNPSDVFTSATGSPVAEVDTITPAGTITAADNFVIEIPGGNNVNFVAVSGSVTPTNIVTGLKASWNADPVAAALATASGTATLILTAKASGEPMGLTSYVEGVGTAALVITTPSVAGQTAEVDTWTLTTAPSTGDTFTLTYTQPNAQTITAVATVGATQTVAAATVLIAAAWNAVPALAALAAATSTATTVVLTGVTLGQQLNTAMTTNSASTTLAKVTTTPALGRTFSDIGRGYILQPYGYWKV
jgi:hypothetical protein